MKARGTVNNRGINFALDLLKEPAFFDETKPVPLDPTYYAHIKKLESIPPVVTTNLRISLMKEIRPQLIFSLHVFSIHSNMIICNSESKNDIRRIKTELAWLKKAKTVEEFKNLYKQPLPLDFCEKRFNECKTAAKKLSFVFTNVEQYSLVDVMEKHKAVVTVLDIGSLSFGIRHTEINSQDADVRSILGENHSPIVIFSNQFEFGSAYRLEIFHGNTAKESCCSALQEKRFAQVKYECKNEKNENIVVYCWQNNIRPVFPVITQTYNEIKINYEENGNVISVDPETMKKKMSDKFRELNIGNFVFEIWSDAVYSVKKNSSDSQKYIKSLHDPWLTTLEEINKIITISYQKLTVYHTGTVAGFGIKAKEQIEKGEPFAFYSGMYIPNSGAELDYSVEVSSSGVHGELIGISQKNIRNLAGIILDAPRNKEQLEKDYEIDSKVPIDAVALANARFVSCVLPDEKDERKGFSLIVVEALEIIPVDTSVRCFYGSGVWRKKGYSPLLFNKDGTVLPAEENYLKMDKQKQHVY